MHSHIEDCIEESILQSPAIDETEKDQLVKSRRGQGRFRKNVQQYGEHCRVTHVTDMRFLIASHIKPWRSSNNSERLDGENGLLLSPNIDAMFDHGFISFDDDGTLLVSAVLDKQVLEQTGVPIDETVNAGRFTEGKKSYLAYHRRAVFLEAGRES